MKRVYTQLCQILHTQFAISLSLLLLFLQFQVAILAPAGKTSGTTPLARTATMKLCGCFATGDRAAGSTAHRPTDAPGWCGRHSRRQLSCALGPSLK